SSRGRMTVTPVLCRALCTVQWPTRTPATSVSALRASGCSRPGANPSSRMVGMGDFLSLGGHGTMGKRPLETKNKNEGDDRRAHPLTGSPHPAKPGAAEWLRDHEFVRGASVLRLRRRQMRPGRPLPAAPPPL